jgi:hypothetical protein
MLTANWFYQFIHQPFLCCSIVVPALSLSLNHGQSRREETAGQRWAILFAATSQSMRVFHRCAGLSPGIHAYEYCPCCRLYSGFAPLVQAAEPAT